MAKKQKKIDKEYLWHPFTQMKSWLEDDQLVIERGDGVYLYDTRGKKYLDGISSLWVTVHGHRHKTLNQAIKKQLDKVAHSTLLGLANVPSLELAKELVEITPKGLDKVFYSDNGSTAVEIALKIAFQYQQQIGQKKKKKFLTLKNAYHGDTIGSVSVGGIDLFHKIYKPLLFKAYKAKPDLFEVEKIMKAHHQEIAAMIVEPLIQAAAGMLLQPKGFLKGVRKLCNKYNILLICDEVATGFGRTGKMFACEHAKISPDIMCLAKGITGGYLPIAATLTTKKIFNAFLAGPKEVKTFFHGHTYTGNPLGCAAALANLEIFKNEQTIKKLQPKISFLKNQLRSLAALPQVKEVRQLGFMVGIELNSSYQKSGHQVILEARKRGAILRPLGNVIVLMPPLSISQRKLSDLLDITRASITEF
ncbi:MAG: adenosylmethionine--8-amino-7-oxononanoate transaminase [Candidatus Margulisiibacteriota bacterium]